MSISRGNSVMLLDNVTFNQNIDIHFKERYWIKTVGQDGSVLYTVQTWKQLTERADYQNGHGGTAFIDDSILTVNGSSVNIGTRYIVSINASAMLGDIGELIKLTPYYLNFTEANQFIIENTK